MDCQTAEVTDDEASVETPKIFQETFEKEMDGTRPVTLTKGRANEGGDHQRQRNRSNFTR